MILLNTFFIWQGRQEIAPFCFAPPLWRARSDLLRVSSLRRTCDFGILLKQISVVEPRPDSPTKEATRQQLLGGFFWQGRQDSNLRHPVLETGALPTELLP
jgi:hypothetical protein